MDGFDPQAYNRQTDGFGSQGGSGGIDRGGVDLAANLLKGLSIGGTSQQGAQAGLNIGSQRGAFGPPSSGGPPQSGGLGFNGRPGQPSQIGGGPLAANQNRGAPGVLSNNGNNGPLAGQLGPGARPASAGGSAGLGGVGVGPPLNPQYAATPGQPFGTGQGSAGGGLLSSAVGSGGLLGQQDSATAVASRDIMAALQQGGGGAPGAMPGGGGFGVPLAPGGGIGGLDAAGGAFSMVSEEFPALGGLGGGGGGGVSGNVGGVTGGGGQGQGGLGQGGMGGSGGMPGGMPLGSGNALPSVMGGSGLGQQHIGAAQPQGVGGMQLGGLGQQAAADSALMEDPNNAFGLLGLLTLIRKDPDTSLLSLGTDLTSLGLNLNAQETLYSRFTTPLDEQQYSLPACYSAMGPLKNTHYSKFSIETLLYVFYCLPSTGDNMHIHAAAELYSRSYRYHKELQTWFTQQPVGPGLPTTPGGYVFFDVPSWSKKDWSRDGKLPRGQAAGQPLSFMPEEEILQALSGTQN